MFEGPGVGLEIVGSGSSRSKDFILSLQSRILLSENEAVSGRERT